jgi:hypothetical protein
MESVKNAPKKSMKELMEINIIKTYDDDEQINVQDFLKSDVV